SSGHHTALAPLPLSAARQLLESAQAFKQTKINEAAGDAARFTQVAAEYSKAPQVTGERYYVEAMEQILPKIRKTIVDPGGNLDLTIIRRGEPAATQKK
ncbi:MAG: FtsH protease activity modulator HflK, partial [Bryobacteraceae bacterium]